MHFVVAMFWGQTDIYLSRNLEAFEPVNQKIQIKCRGFYIRG